MPRNETASEVTPPQPAASSVPARGTIQLLSARGCFMASGYLISLILARGLGPVEYGIYGVVMSVLLWIEMLGSAGIPAAMTKLIPQQEHQAAMVEQTARLLLLIVSLGLFVFFWVLAPVCTRLLGIPTGTALFRLAILDIPLNGLYLAYQGVLYTNRQFGLLSLGFVTYSLVKLAGILALFVLGLSISGALVVNVLATVGALIYLVGKLPPRGWLPSVAFMSTVLRVALPMGLYSGLLQVVLSLDLWLLQSLWHGPGEVIGFYVAALNIARLPVIVPSVLTGVLFVSLSWALARTDEALAQRYLQGAGRFAFVVLFPSCILVILYATPFMTLLYSGVYATGGAYLRLQIIAFGCMAFLDIFLAALIVADKHYQSVGTLLAMLPLAVLFNVILIPRFGAFGAAAALVCTFVVGTVLAIILAYRRFGALMRVSTIVRVVVATTLMAVIGTQIPLLGPWILLKFIILLGIYVLCLILLKELSWEDIRPFAMWQKT